MSEATRRAAIERVVVPLDSASEHRVAIDTAVRLAAQAQATLHGIFVEDEDLLNLASLPFTRQITLGAAAEALTPEHVALHLRLAANRARGELLAAAGRHGVEATFEIVRGASDAALSAASERDLLVAGGQTRPIGRHFRLACRWWSAIEVARGPVLLARHAWPAQGFVVVLLHDRGAASVRLLAAAAQIANAGEHGLTVLCPPEVAGAEGFEQWLADHLAGSVVQLRVEVDSIEPVALSQRITALECRLLAVGPGPRDGDRLRQLAERCACDVLVVR